MKIKEINIENIRGIESYIINDDIHPNKPTIIVAPNGFGKTSIATAFRSLKRNKIEVKDEDAHKNNQNLIPYLKVKDEEAEYIATSSLNTLSSVFDVFTIGGQVKSKATSRNFGGFSSSKASLIVEPIIFYSKIPSKQSFAYSYAKMKIKFENSAAKLLINLGDYLTATKFVCKMDLIKKDIAKIEKARFQTLIQECLIKFESFSGSKTEVILENINLQVFFEKEPVKNILKVFNCIFGDMSGNEKFLNIVQMEKVFSENNKDFKKIIGYYRFLNDKNEINEMLSFFNCTWKEIKARKKKGRLVLEFPLANQISNGERDILCFIGKLFEAKKALNKKKCILIIDEIFDYLDDANLIAAQYFLIKFINQFKESDKELFPIIFTHLDPMCFSTYNFSIKNVIYLKKNNIIQNKCGINNLLKDRDNCRKCNEEIYKCISSNYLHYSLIDDDAFDYLLSKGVDNNLCTSRAFKDKAIEELHLYIEGNSYDPIWVCCGLRIKIEEMACVQLKTDKKSEFINTFKTVDKISYAKNEGANVPEVHFLLSIIYNEAMHLDSQCKKVIPIIHKLNNKVIHNMIKEACNQ